MKLLFSEIHENLLSENNLSLVQIESPQLFLRFHRALFIEQFGGEQQFQIFNEQGQENTKINYEWISSPWTINVEKRKLLNSYYFELEQRIIEFGLDLEIAQKWEEIRHLLQQNITGDMFACIENDSISLQHIFKSFNIRLLPDTNSPFLEQLIDYLLLKRNYENVSIFLIDHLFSYLEEQDVPELQKFCQQECVSVILIESGFQSNSVFMNGRHLIIDKDLCEILRRAT